MQFDTKVALVIRQDLETWQKMNVAAFLASGVAAAYPNCIGEHYEDGSGTKYHALIGQPILIYGADRATLSRALERGLGRDGRLHGGYAQNRLRCRKSRGGKGCNSTRTQSRWDCTSGRPQSGRKSGRRPQVSFLSHHIQGLRLLSSFPRIVSAKPAIGGKIPFRLNPHE